jgi:ADP-heptose:LPS heptosyltransferase
MALGRPRLLILRALGIGDLLTAAPALRGLAAAFPDHERILATPGALRPLVELVDSLGGGPAVHRIAPLAELASLPRALHRSDVAVNLHGRGPQSHQLLLSARPARTLWFEHAEVEPSRGSPRWRRGEHEVGRWCRMLTESGVACNATELTVRAPAGRPPDGTPGATILHPGAASPARRWPADRFARVARAEAERGHPVVITGPGGDVGVATYIAHHGRLPESSILVGRTTLADLARGVAAAGRVVCGDTGLGHLATALGTPSVLLFGPTAPAEWGPPVERTQHRALWAGQRGDPHGNLVDRGLLEISAAEVIRALEELPARPQATRA